MQSQGRLYENGVVRPIKKMESYLMSKCFINHDFHELGSKSYEYKLSKWNVLIWLVYVTHAIKYLLHFLTINQPRLSVMIGHLMRPIGVTGDAVVLGQSLFASWCSIMMYILMKNQRKKKLHVLADFDMFIQEDVNKIHVIRGVPTIGRTQLWPENFSTFAKHAKFAMIFPPLLGYLWPFFVVPLGVFGTYDGFQKDGNTYLMLYRSLWTILLWTFIWYYGWFFSLQCVMFYLSSLYLNKRFEQLKVELDHLMSVSNKRMSITMSITAETIVPADTLDRFLVGFNVLCDRVHEYNRIFKYFLFCMTFCGMGIFTGCVMILMPKEETAVEKLVKWPLYVGSVEAMFGITFFASVAGNVHSNSKSFYPLFNTLLVRSMKLNVKRTRFEAVGIKGDKNPGLTENRSELTLDEEVFVEGTKYNWYPRSLQVKLRSMILRVSCEHLPVSFFSLDLHPFTHLSFANMGISTFGTILLALGLVYKLN